MPTAALVLALGLSITPPADPVRAALLQAGYTGVPLSVVRNMLHVECTVQGEKTKMLLDTGAAPAVFDMAIAKKLKWELGDEYNGFGIGGKWVGRVVEFPPGKIGGYDTANDTNIWRAVAKDMPGEEKGVGGLIGTNVLEQYSAVIDYPTRTLYLRSPLATAWPLLEGKWAATSWQDEDKPRTLDPKTAPTFEFADNKLKLTDGDTTREFAIHFISSGDTHMMALFDPKNLGKADPEYKAGGLIKFGKGTITACLFLDRAKIKAAPAEFAAPPGSGFTLIELKAATPGKPRPDSLRELLKKVGYTAVPMPREENGWRVVKASVGKQELKLVVDTGCLTTAFHTPTLRGFNGTDPQQWAVRGFGGVAKAELSRFRGLRVGEYETQGAWASTLAVGTDLEEINKAREARKQPAVDGLLGDLDLRNGSAVLDLGTDTLYLRPFKQTLWPKLQGRWVGVAWEHDGQAGKYRPEDKQVVEFADGKMTFDVPGEKATWGFYLLDEGVLYSSEGEGELIRYSVFDPKAKETADDFTYAADGLLRLTGDKLVLLTVNDPLKAKGLPTAFAAPQGSGFVRVEYVRAK